MGSNFKLLVLVLIGLLLLWFGYKLFIMLFKKNSQKDGNRSMKLYKESVPPDSEQGSGGEPNTGGAPSGAKPRLNPYKGTANPGGLMICPICLFRMDNGEMIKTTAFPSMTAWDKDRLMHIHGCVYCMDGKRERLCPVCGKTLSLSDFLVARIFDRPHKRSHVHVLGCTQCRPLKTM
jgi:hypothetical protein